MDVDAEPARDLVVEEADAGQRLDRWLAARLDQVTRSQIGRAVEEGRILVNGVAPTKAGLALRAGDVVSVGSFALPLASATPQDLPVAVVYADARVIVVDKPPGMVVHPAHGHPDGTLVNALAFRFGALEGGEDPLRPGIVHRLDRDTSGLMVVARDAAAHAALAVQFRDRTVHRRYLAVVHGTRLEGQGAEGVIDTPFGRHPTDRKRMTGRHPDGEPARRAVTRFTVLERGAALSLVMLRLETGRTHQIRVHLAERGYPVVGDTLYGRETPRGGGDAGRELAAARRIGRHALHAATLGFAHPDDGALRRWDSPPPADLAALIRDAFGQDTLDAAIAKLAGE